MVSSRIQSKIYLKDGYLIQHRDIAFTDKVELRTRLSMHSFTVMEMLM